MKFWRTVSRFIDNKKDDSYYVKKIMTDLYFIKDHISEVTKAELAQNEILLDSMLFRLIEICENAKKTYRRLQSITL